MAFPCISTGVYGYPIDDAAEIAVREAEEFVKTRADMEIVFCCFSRSDAAIYDDLLKGK